VRRGGPARRKSFDTNGLRQMLTANTMPNKNVDLGLTECLSLTKETALLKVS